MIRDRSWVVIWCLTSMLIYAGAKGLTSHRACQDIPDKDLRYKGKIIVNGRNNANFDPVFYGLGDTYNEFLRGMVVATHGGPVKVELVLIEPYSYSIPDPWYIGYGTVNGTWYNRIVRDVRELDLKHPSEKDCQGFGGTEAAERFCSTCPFRGYAWYDCADEAKASYPLEVGSCANPKLHGGFDGKRWNRVWASKLDTNYHACCSRPDGNIADCANVQEPVTMTIGGAGVCSLTVYPDISESANEDPASPNPTNEVTASPNPENDISASPKPSATPVLLPVIASALLTAILVLLS